MTETLLYSFGASGTDGSYPIAGLTNLNGTLYGTTNLGGLYGYGTVFSVTTAGTYSRLYNFAGGWKHGPDGAYPQADLTNVNGTLYGTTYFGGASGDGTVFRITTSGTYSRIHSFTGSDGAKPGAGLTNVGGTLYGTTQYGGATGHGTVFTITKSGTYSRLYSFAGGSDGCPNGLTNVSGLLYGTTGGCNLKSYGSVFKITLSGTVTVLYTFKGGVSDGAHPTAALTNVDGVLFGTTGSGGPQGYGTVFKITTAGKETVLHFFAGEYDGAQPFAELRNVRGTLYGTTTEGGPYKGPRGEGTVFKITRSGKETVLYSFEGEPDGSVPEASLTNVGGKLYGTTATGGATNGGTVFSLSGF
ncbi:MAG: choice-of-anchor tandem repeat GloVer-containing protein [Candidatus Tumulicola sp.]